MSTAPDERRRVWEGMSADALMSSLLGLGESVVTTARECGPGPLRYVEWLLGELPLAGDLGDPSVADRYLPWSDAVPASVRIPGADVASLRAAQEEPVADVDPGALREDE